MSENILEVIGNANLKPKELKELLLAMNRVDIADIFEHIDNTEKIVQIFKLLPKDMAAAVFSYLEPDKQHIMISALTDIEIKRIVDDLFLDDAVDFLEEMPANVVKKVLENTSRNTRETINELLKYPENSAGSIMTPEYIDLKQAMTIAQSIERIRKIGSDRETLDTSYVMNSHRVLDGVVSIRTLLLSNDDDILENVMTTNPLFVKTTDDREYASSLFMKYDLTALPVVDNESRLVGIITIDDIVDVIQEENTEDFEIMAAMSPSEKPYLKTSFFKLAGNRVPWLLFLMLSAAITGQIIDSFEEQLASQMALLAFMPMLMSTGGNAGSQSATLIIRGMALNEIKISNFFLIVIKECSVALLAGTFLAIINFFRILLFNGEALIALTVSLSIIFTVLMANIIGGILPLFAKFIKVDPALMAAPLISTICDALSLMVFFNIARVLLSA